MFVLSLKFSKRAGRYVVYGSRKKIGEDFGTNHVQACLNLAISRRNRRKRTQAVAGVSDWIHPRFLALPKYCSQVSHEKVGGMLLHIEPSIPLFPLFSSCGRCELSFFQRVSKAMASFIDVNSDHFLAGTGGIELIKAEGID